MITGAHGLPNRHVIHCLGPVYGRDEPSDTLLASCYRRALELAEQRRITSLAFPALSTGAFGFPLERAAHIAFSTSVTEIPGLETVERIRFVLYSADDLEAHRRALEAVLNA